jgi:hypothetical protein
VPTTARAVATRRASPHSDRVSRADVIRHAFAEYHAGRITLAELVRTIAAWRPTS